MGFSADALRRLDEAEEVEIETRGRVIIWVVVDGDDVFLRSVNAERGRWYRELMASPSARLHVPGLADGPILVRAVPAADAASVERCSAAFRRKYAADPALGSMLRPDTLPTTIRLEPVVPSA